MSVFSVEPATSIALSITLRILTTLPSTERNGVRARVQGKFHWDAEDNMAATSIWLVHPDGRTAVHTAQIRKEQDTQSYYKAEGWGYVHEGVQRT